MDTAELEIFRAVAHERSVTRAARALNRAQSNVTTRIQQLEEQLGITLFARQNKRMELTPEGHLFLSYSERILALTEEARQSIRQDIAQGVLRIGSMESSAASRLPNPLMTFHAANPGVKVELTTGPTGPLVIKVLEHKLDCAIVAHPFNGPHERVRWEDEDPELEGVYLFTEKLMLITPRGFGKPRRRDRSATVKTLAAFSSGCTYRKCAETWIASLDGGGSSAHWSILEVSSYHAILACVASGSAVGCLPQSVLDLYCERIPFETSLLRSVHTFIVKRKGFATPAYEAFLKVLRKHS